VVWLRPDAWHQWDGERLRRNGGTLEQYKHPCLIADTQFHEKMRKEAVVHRPAADPLPLT
jgi:hypothetical protein